MKNPAVLRKSAVVRTSAGYSEYPVLAFILFATLAIGFGSSRMLDELGTLI